MLENVMNTKGVRQVALVSAEGQVVEAQGGTPDVALVAAGRAVSGSLITALGSGEMKDMLIEFEDGPVLLSNVAGQTLITAFDDLSSLGRVRFALKKLAATLA